MRTLERINLHVRELPRPFQVKVLNFAEFLASKLTTSDSRQRDLLWSQFSISQARRGIEEEMALKKAGQIVPFNFPQTEFVNGKLRPALILAKLPGDYDDWLFCMISSQTHQYLKGFDDIIIAFFKCVCRNRSLAP